MSRAGYLADLLIADYDHIPRDQWRCGSDSQPHQLFIDMAAGVDSLDHLLTEVTPLGETHRVIDGDLEQQVVLSEIDTVTRHTRFNAQDIMRVLANPGRAEWFAELS